WDGSLEPIAERMFSELPHQRFLCEWEDTSREGGYSPIRFVPRQKLMVMGLVSTKNTSVEDPDDVIRRLEQAARFLDISQLAVSPQCGFASVYTDHLVEREEVQWRKLRVVGEVAARVWGDR